MLILTPSVITEVTRHGKLLVCQFSQLCIVTSYQEWIRLASELSSFWPRSLGSMWSSASSRSKQLVLCLSLLHLSAFEIEATAESTSFSSTAVHLRVAGPASTPLRSGLPAACNQQCTADAALFRVGGGTDYSCVRIWLHHKIPQLAVATAMPILSGALDPSVQASVAVSRVLALETG